MSLTNATSNSEVFLSSDFLAIGVNFTGTLGSRTNAPSGFTTDSANGYLRIGMFADLDGFGKGAAPVLRDAILSGTPVESFTVGYKLGGTAFEQTNSGLNAYKEIAGTLTNTSSATAGQASWSGATSEKVGVDQKITMLDGGKYVRVDVTLTNNGTSTVSDLRYLRSIDPDINPATFSTYNKVVEPGAGKGLVTATTSSTSGNALFLYANDSRVVATVGGFENVNAHDALVTTAQAKGYAATGDIALNLDFNLGSLAPGQSTTLTFFVGITNGLSTTISAIDSALPVVSPPPANLAPDAIDDALAVVAGAIGTGNVLSNDKDPDGNSLSASLVTGPANGSLTLNANGSFTYAPKAGFTGTDSFTYAASDGSLTDQANVSITVTAPPAPAPAPSGLPASALLAKAGTIDLSLSANQTVAGASHHNAFYVDALTVTGTDTISNFGRNDILVLNKPIYDGNNDGVIAFKNNKVDVDGALGSDNVVLKGVSALRLMGAVDGLSVYANNASKPKGAFDSKIGNDNFSGDAANLSKQVFFFDTGLDLHLGNDHVSNFGSSDIIVTTSALVDGNNDGVIASGGDGIFDLVGGAGAPDDLSASGEAGSVLVTGTNGAIVDQLEFDGTMSAGGITYYVYSAVGSAIGTDGLLL